MGKKPNTNPGIYFVYSRDKYGGTFFSPTLNTLAEAEDFAANEIAPDTQIIGPLPAVAVKTNTIGLGTPGTGVTAYESACGQWRKTTLKLVNTAVALVDNAGVVAYGNALIYTFPLGRIFMQGGQCKLTLSKSSAGVNADWEGDVSVGQIAANSGATLSGSEGDYVPSTPVPEAVAGVSNVAGVYVAGSSSGAILNGSATPIEARLNVLVDDADHDVTGTPCNIIANGLVSLFWRYNGLN